MGWWRTEDGKSVIGDGPVDLVISAHREVVARRGAAAGPEPSTLFDAAARVMREVDALPSPDGWPESDGGGWENEELPVLGHALAEVVGEYEMSELDREPTAAEIHATIDFAVAELK